MNLERSKSVGIKKISSSLKLERKVSVPLAKRETSPRQCNICGQIKHTVSSSPRNSPSIPEIIEKCEDCISK